LKKGDLDRAVKEDQEALRLKKDCPDAHRYLGLTLDDQGDLEDLPR
jgi:hypothetical protein